MRASPCDFWEHFVLFSKSLQEASRYLLRILRWFLEKYQSFHQEDFWNYFSMIQAFSGWDLSKLSLWWALSKLSELVLWSLGNFRTFSDMSPCIRQAFPRRPHCRLPFPIRLRTSVLNSWILTKIPINTKTYNKMYTKQTNAQYKLYTGL